jgi:quercetin dioxygenase-like cupin family protein
MLAKHSKTGYTEILKGLKIKTLCHGPSTLMSEFQLEKDAELPEHSHPYEQTGYLVKGKIRFTINGTSALMEPGDSWCVPSDVLHQAEILEDSVLIEVFSPVREEYLKYWSAENQHPL